MAARSRNDTDALTPWGGDAFITKIVFETAPAMTIGCITNAASLDSAGISPGEIVTLWGVDLGPEAGGGARLDSSGRLATSIGDTQVLFDGVAAPLTYAGKNQVNAVVPYGVAANSETRVQVQYRGAPSNVVTVLFCRPTPESSPLIRAVRGRAPFSMRTTPSIPRRSLPRGGRLLFCLGPVLVKPIRLAKMASLPSLRFRSHLPRSTYISMA